MAIHSLQHSTGTDRRILSVCTHFSQQFNWCLFVIDVFIDLYLKIVFSLSIFLHSFAIRTDFLIQSIQQRVYYLACYFVHLFCLCNLDSVCARTMCDDFFLSSGVCIFRNNNSNGKKSVLHYWPMYMVYSIHCTCIHSIKCFTLYGN